MKTGSTNVGSCVSSVGYKSEYSPRRKWGIFKYPQVARRLVLATPPAFRSLNQNEILLADLNRDLRQGEINEQILMRAGFIPHFHHGGRADWVTFSIHFWYPPARELGAFNQAMEIVHSPARGVGRRILFGILGIEASGYEELSEEMYMALLGRVGRLYDPNFERVRFLTVTDKPNDEIIETARGDLRLSISRIRLQQEPARFIPKQKHFSAFPGQN